jgi:hypothetical protein
MAEGFTARADMLTAGSRRVTEQGQHCEEVATAVVEMTAGMAGAAGHPGLASALAGASETGTETFAVTGALYAHVAEGLRQNAASYDRAEQSIIEQLPRAQ